MGLVQKDALRTTMISSFGLVLGYLNKGLLFLLIFSTEQIGVVNLIFSLGVLFAQFSNLGSLYSIWKFFPFFKRFFLIIFTMLDPTTTPSVKASCVSPNKTSMP